MFMATMFTRYFQMQLVMTPWHHSTLLITTIPLQLISTGFLGSTSNLINLLRILTTQPTPPVIQLLIPAALLAHQADLAHRFFLLIGQPHRNIRSFVITITKFG